MLAFLELGRPFIIAINFRNNVTDILKACKQNQDLNEITKLKY